jgi:predicted PurR-regulated permease PerM
VATQYSKKIIFSGLAEPSDKPTPGTAFRGGAQLVQRGCGRSEFAPIEKAFATAPAATEHIVEYVRAKHEFRQTLKISDPQPVGSVRNMWLTASSAATIGIFLLLFVGFLSIARPILLPITFATIVSLTLAPAAKAAQRQGIPIAISAVALVAACFAALAIGVTALAGPLSEWIGRAPEIGASVKTKLSVFDQPLAALRQMEATLFGGDGGDAVHSAPSVVMPLVDFLTPAASEILLFFITLVFCLIVQTRIRNRIVSMFADRDAKLRFLKIIKDIERNLAGYLTIVTCINAAIGVIVAIGTWIIGFPHPLVFGLLAALLNYVPYVGPAGTVVALFGVGLITFPSLGHALIGPLGFIAVTTLEGNFVTPSIVGRHLTLNPLLVIIALAFWTWLWGPFGAFLAVPLSIINLVIIQHLLPHDDIKLPE